MSHWYLIYDDSCPICLGAIEKLKKLDRADLIILTPLSRAELPAEFVLPAKEELIEQMYLYSPDNEVFKGADAVRQILSIFPQSRLLGWLISLPILKQLSRICYGIIAKNRMKISNS